MARRMARTALVPDVARRARFERVDGMLRALREFAARDEDGGRLHDGATSPVKLTFGFGLVPRRQVSQRSSSYSLLAGCETSVRYSPLVFFWWPGRSTYLPRRPNK